jgi:pyruvate/2-oxoglutarate/acetoin dehydrogenase E1 component
MPEVTYLEAIRQGIWEEMERDPAVMLLGEDIASYGGAFKVTEGMLACFGADRVIDTPISEQAIIGAAAGAAHMGLRPICEMQFADFIACAYDMLTNYVATARYRAGLATPMVVRGPAGGYVRGGPFHSQMPEAGFLHTPGLKIVCPATARDARGLIKAAIRDEDPVLYFEHKYLYRRVKEVLPADDLVTPIGPARVARPGRDLTIVTWSAMVWKALEAAERCSTCAPCCRWTTSRSRGRYGRPAGYWSHMKTPRLAGSRERSSPASTSWPSSGSMLRCGGLVPTMSRCPTLRRWKM